MMLTPTPFDMGVIIMGVNSCAVDTVGCHMVNVNPEDIIHLKMSSERGFGPIDINEIEVKGDYPLGEIQKKTRDFQFCFEHIDSYFHGRSNLRCTVGSFPEEHSKDYCWGGCPGALQEAMHIFEGYYPGAMKNMKKVHYVVGKIDGDLITEPDEKVIFAGNCTSFEGEINGKKVSIKSGYRQKDDVSVFKTKSNDMIMKIMSSLSRCFIKRKSPYIQAKGCPVSVAEHVNYLSSSGKIGNVNFDMRTLIPVFSGYLQMRFFRFFNRIFFR